MEYLLKASAVVVLFYLCFYIFLKKETFFQHNRWFLLIGLLIALVFPFIAIPVHIPIEPIVIPEIAYVQTIPIDFIATQPETTFDWTNLFPILYGIGFTVFFIQFVLQFGSLALLLLKNPKYKDELFTYVIVENKISPFSFFKWIVYNPDVFENDELDLILTHEKVHAKQLHSIDILIVQLACVIFWFNPLIWLYRKEVRQNLEYIADYKTQIKTIDQKKYQRLLLKTSIANHNMSLSNNFYNSLIKERIIMLKKSRSNRNKQWRYLLIFPLLAGLLMSMNTETIYIETESITISNENIIEFVVTKNTTESELKTMSNVVEQKGGSLIFSEIKRNNKNELTSIFVKLYNHSYGGGNSNQPIESFIIYKELFGDKGGYVGSVGNGTIHFDSSIDINTKNKKEIEALKIRAYKPMLKHQLQTIDKQLGFSKKNQNSNSFKLIEIVFTKKTTDKQLEDIKKELKSQGVTMIIKRLKRNNKNEIVDINLDFKTKNGSANYNVKDKDGIKAFYFNMEDDGSFGVGAINNDMHEIETIHESLPKKSHSKSKSNVFILKDNDSLELIVEDSLNPKILNRYRKIINKLNNAKKNDTIHIVRDYKIDSTSLKTGYFHQYDGPVRVISAEENITIHNPSKLSQNSFIYRNQNIPKPLYVVDGKVVENYHLNALNPKNIKQINVLKGDSATEIYGEKGENGVIVITTKGKNTWTAKSDVKENNPWRTEVSSVTYIDDEDASKNGTLAYITKYTSDEVLDKHKSDLEKFDLKVKLSKVKRNKNGEITSIKISIRNEQGDESSASWKDDDGIPGIEFGKFEGSLVARTSTMN